MRGTTVSNYSRKN